MRKSIFKSLLLICSLSLMPKAQAASVKVTKIQNKASFIEQNHGIFKPLDLKTKVIRFTPSDSNSCGQALQRRLRTLTYSCTIDLPSQAQHSKLKNQITPEKLKVQFGRLKKEVSIRVSNDAKRLILRTHFDETGVDFEITRFNDDFFAIFAKSAQLVFQKALNKGLKINVLEDSKSKVSSNL